MENATKALLMAAGVLIGIVILSLGVYLYGTIGNYVQMSQEEMNNQALIKFNTQFYNYTAIENQQYTFQDIITIANIAYENNSEKELLDETESSYGTDYVDVYMTHWQATPGTEYFVPIQKTMDVLNDLKAQGKIKAIGAANVDINHIQEYIKYGDLDIIQCKYSILDRGIEDEIIPCARENGITIQCYSPLEMGLLSGTFPRDYKPVGAQIPKKWFQPENMQNAMDMMESWKPLCEKYDCTIANLALGWILAQGDFLNLLSGSTTVDEIRENVKSAELELDPEDVAFMRESAEAIDK